MTARYSLTELSVCQDCILLLANGGCDGCDSCAFTDDPDHPCRTVADRMVAVWGEDTRHLSPDGGELGFSGSDCDGCGSPLAGDRYRAHAVIPA